MQKSDKKTLAGFSLVEVLLAVAVFAMAVTPIIISLTYGQESAALAGSLARANFLAGEGIEAVRNIRDENFFNLTDSVHGLAVADGKWIFSDTFDTADIYRRQVTIASVDADTKSVEVKVTWPQNLQRNGDVALTTYLTNWRAPIPKGGMVVYGDGGTSSDAIKYRTLDIISGVWNESKSAGDIDESSSNKHLRSVKIYSSATRNEKVVISRHYDGAAQSIYAQVYDGSSWGDVTSLASWNDNNFLDVQNFGGTYLSNGNFMAVYSDNSATPRMKIWNGDNWSASSSLGNLGTGQTPVYIDIENRAGTDEVMAAFFTQASDTLTKYYSGSDWSAAVSHSTAAPTNTKRFMDFDWSFADPAVGALIYANGTKDKNISGKIWVANGTGGGAWGRSSSSLNQVDIIGAMDIAARPGAGEFQACNKDADTTPAIRCFGLTYSGNRAAFFNPENPMLVAETDGGIERSFDMAFAYSGSRALAAYSDNSGTPKFKKYDGPTRSWDPGASNVGTPGYSPASLKAITLVPYEEGSEDVMILMADDNQNVYSAVWNGASGAIYDSPSGKAFTRHGTAGSADPDFWFDFAWDKY